MGFPWANHTCAGWGRRAARAAALLTACLLAACTGRTDRKTLQEVMVKGFAEDLQQADPLLSNWREKAFFLSEGRLGLVTEKLPPGPADLTALRQDRDTHALLLSVNALLETLLPEPQRQAALCSLLFQTPATFSLENTPLARPLLSEGWTVHASLHGTPWLVATATPVPPGPGTGARLGLGPLPVLAELLTKAGWAPQTTAPGSLAADIDGHVVDGALLPADMLEEELLHTTPHLHPTDLPPLPLLVLLKTSPTGALEKEDRQRLQASLKSAGAIFEAIQDNRWHKQQAQWDDGDVAYHKTPVPLGVRQICGK